MTYVTFVVHPWEAGGPELTREPTLCDLNSTVRPSLPFFLFAFLSRVVDSCRPQFEMSLWSPWCVVMVQYLEQSHSGMSLITLLVHSSGLRSWLRALPQVSCFFMTEYTNLQSADRVFSMLRIRPGVWSMYSTRWGHVKEAVVLSVQLQAHFAWKPCTSPLLFQ